MTNKSYSQYGEDLEILKFFGRSSSGYYVDIGANNGIRDSNTALLEMCGWQGLLIEANPDLIAAAIRSRPNSTVIHSAIVAPKDVGTIQFYQVVGGPENLDGLSTTVKSDRFIQQVVQHGGKIETIAVPANTLEALLAKHNVPSKFELLSIDVEGIELQVLQSLSFENYQPKLIVVEDNSSGLDWRVRNYLKDWNYCHVCRTGVNDWYVRAADISRFRSQRVKVRIQYFKWWIKYKILKRHRQS